MLVPTITMLVALSGSASAAPAQVGNGEITLVRADDAHTLFTPNTMDSGRSGQIYQLPQGGVGVTTGGTPYYQTYATPGGGGIAVPNGNNTFNVIGSSGRAGIARVGG
jgi:hypothetical protein